MIPPGDRPTPQDYQARAHRLGAQGPSCPKCRWPLLAYRTSSSSSRILRYEKCRNPNCEARYLTRQEHRSIIREVDSEANGSPADSWEKDSRSGND